MNPFQNVIKLSKGRKKNPCVHNRSAWARHDTSCEILHSLSERRCRNWVVGIFFGYIDVSRAKLHQNHLTCTFQINTNLLGLIFSPSFDVLRLCRHRRFTMCHHCCTGCDTGNHSFALCLMQHPVERVYLKSLRCSCSNNMSTSNASRSVAVFFFLWNAILPLYYAHQAHEYR